MSNNTTHNTLATIHVKYILSVTLESFIRGALSLIKPVQTGLITLHGGSPVHQPGPQCLRAPVGPMKGVFPTPDAGSFSPADTDIQTKINVGRHRHSELLARHWTLHSPASTRRPMDVGHSHCQVDARHCGKLRVDTRHRNPPSWALPVAPYTEILLCDRIFLKRHVILHHTIPKMLFCIIPYQNHMILVGYGKA